MLCSSDNDKDDHPCCWIVSHPCPSTAHPLKGELPIVADLSIALIKQVLAVGVALRAANLPDGTARHPHDGPNRHGSRRDGTKRTRHQRHRPSGDGDGGIVALVLLEEVVRRCDKLTMWWLCRDKIAMRWLCRDIMTLWWLCRHQCGDRHDVRRHLLRNLLLHRRGQRRGKLCRHCRNWFQKVLASDILLRTAPLLIDVFPSRIPVRRRDVAIGVWRRCCDRFLAAAQFFLIAAVLRRRGAPCQGIG
mmetsp:Transcript_38604/g.124050  ORF Transcript_38604/g.124050 Transcript_38604/m.124050 type:complete len:247 (+) Transcript_38604:466-1206(+)